MNYLDVCSGISAPTAAWRPLGWKAVAFSEIEKAPSAVLAHHYPDVPNLGDMTKFEEWPDYANLDVLVGGTPCQSYSIAGKRKGLADPRGRLMLSYLGIADRYRPRWVVWENVPGVLSSNGGRDFGTFLGALAKLGYIFAYRVLDAQYFGVAQRRERVFVVGHLGDWRRAAEVLFERESLCGYPAPRRETRESFTHDLAPSLTASGRGVERSGDSRGQDPVVPVPCAMRLSESGHGSGFMQRGVSDPQLSSEATSGVPDSSHSRGSNGRLILGGGSQIANCLTTHQVKGGDPTTDNYVVTGGFFDQPAHTLRADGFDASEDGTGRGTPLVPICAPLTGNPYGDHESRESLLVPVAHCEVLPTMLNGANTPAGHNAVSGHSKDAYVVPMAMNLRGRDGGAMPEMSDLASLRAADGGSSRSYLLERWRVRRITPREAERLQGFPDDFTLVPYRGKLMADGPRYKMLGNSMAVPVVRWIGERIAMVDAVFHGQMEIAQVLA